MKLIIDDIDPSENIFFASISNDDCQEMILRCSFYTDEQEELYGDQVSAIHVVGYFNSVEEIVAYGDNGFPMTPPVELVKSAMDQLKDVELEIESRECQVNYSARYYDLI
jgi:hypothetical protein